LKELLPCEGMLGKFSTEHDSDILLSEVNGLKQGYIPDLKINKPLINYLIII
jgi:hypothetical protein